MKVQYYIVTLYVNKFKTKKAAGLLYRLIEELLACSRTN